MTFGRLRVWELNARYSGLRGDYCSNQSVIKQLGSLLPQHILANPRRANVSVLGSAEPRPPSASASGQIRRETSSLSVGDIIFESSLSKVRAAECREWGGGKSIEGRCAAGELAEQNGSAGRCGRARSACTYKPTHAVRGRLCGQRCRDRPYGWGAGRSPALIPDFPLHVAAPAVPVPARQRARRAA